MASDTTIEMVPVAPSVNQSSRPTLRLDIERASRPRSRRSSQEKNTMLLANEMNHHTDHPPSKPLLAPSPMPHDDPPLAALLETDSVGQVPPLAGPEIDDLDDSPEVRAPYPGIDDGLLDPTEERTHPLVPEGDEVDSQTDRHEKRGHGEPHENGHPAHDDDGKEREEVTHDFDEVDYYGDMLTPHGFESRVGGSRPVSPMPDLRSIPDVNVYQQKKNLAQGMMDLALLSANANQLRYVIESAADHPYFWPSIIFISLSIIFQIFVGIGLIWNSAYNVKNEDDICKADKINNLTVIGIFLVTIVNVFITAFSVAQKPIVSA